MTDVTQDFAALDRLDRDLAALRAHRQFIWNALANREDSCTQLDRAVDKDMPAVRKVFDRVDGKTVADVEPAPQGPQETILRWQD